MIGKGSKVEFLSEKHHKIHPHIYPQAGTCGEVLKVHNGDTALIRWPEGSIPSAVRPCRRFALLSDLRKVPSNDYYIKMRRTMSAAAR
jgi:hypothetical protein